MNHYTLKRLIAFIISVTLTFIVHAQSEPQMTGLIDSIMEANYSEDGPGAAIVVVKDHQLLFQSGYGQADLDQAVQITAETKFRIGSITKQFTSVGIMMLLSEGQLSVDDPVSKYYPSLFADKDRITIKQLLSHTSGIVDLSRIRAIRPFMSGGAESIEIIKLISKEELNFKPGTRYEYSNSGYFILGGILEMVSGTTYREFLNDRIFKPLGMKHTHYDNRSEINGKPALGYFTRPENFVNAPDINSSILFSAGGIWSTVSDMAIWNEALYSNELVDQKYIRMAFTPGQLNNGKRTDYGFGFRSCLVNEIKSIEHGGGVFGYSCYGIRIESEGLYVLILTNFERNNKYAELAPIIAAITIENPYHSISEISTIDIDNAQKYIGTYVTPDMGTINIDYQDDKLVLLRDESERVLIQIEAHTFLIAGTLDDKLHFNLQERSFFIKPRRSMAVAAQRI